MIKQFTRKFAAGALAAVMSVSLLGAVGLAPVAHASDKGVSQAYESIFESDNIIDVKVTIADEDWQSILENPLEKEYKSVTAEVDGYELENVGFSTKGNLTLNSVAGMSDSDRYSFRLKFDKYDKSQTLLGLDKLALNNNYSDPSYMREYLHYEALRSIGMDVPETVYVNLYINDELFGFYTAVEAVGDSYLLRNFGEDYEDGVLYEAEAGTTLQYEEDGDYDTLVKDIGSDKDKAKLKNFISVLNSMPDGEKGDIESVLNVDSALQYIATNAVLGNYDSYNGDKGQNFLLYGDADGYFTVIPWDFNMSFNGYTGGMRNTEDDGSTVNTDAVTASVYSPVLGISMESVPMINNLLEVPEYNEQYMQYVSELVDYLSGIENRITGLADLIRPYVEADPTKFYTMEQFESNITYSATEESNGGGTGAPGDGGMTPPEGGEAPTPPEDWEGGTPPDGTVPSEGENGNPGGGGGGGQMASGSIMTFALNRLANLQEQLGLEVTPLPDTDSSSTSADTEAETSADE